MFVNTSKTSNTEYRAVIEFFAWKRLRAAEITERLADVYGDSAPSYRTVAKWVVEFNDSTLAFMDAPRSDRPLTAVTDESIQAVEEIMMHELQISVRCVANQLGISKTPLYEITSDYLTMKKVCTDWVPKLLTPLQRANRVDCCEEILEHCK